MQISTIVDSDLDGCAIVYAEAFSKGPWFEKWSERKAFERLSNLFHAPGFVGLKALENNEIIGLAIGNIEPFTPKDIFYFRDLCVSPTYQKSGVGGALIDNLHDILRIENIERSYLITLRGSAMIPYLSNRGYKFDSNQCIMTFTLGANHIE